MSSAAAAAAGEPCGGGSVDRRAHASYRSSAGAAAAAAAGFFLICMCERFLAHVCERVPTLLLIQSWRHTRASFLIGNAGDALLCGGFALLQARRFTGKRRRIGS